MFLIALSVEEVEEQRRDQLKRKCPSQNISKLQKPKLHRCWLWLDWSIDQSHPWATTIKSFLALNFFRLNGSGSSQIAKHPEGQNSNRSQNNTVSALFEKANVIHFCCNFHFGTILGQLGVKSSSMFFLWIMAWNYQLIFLEQNVK